MYSDLVKSYLARRRSELKKSVERRALFRTRIGRAVGAMAGLLASISIRKLGGSGWLTELGSLYVLLLAVGSLHRHENAGTATRFSQVVASVARTGGVLYALHGLLVLSHTEAAHATLSVPANVALVLQWSLGFQLASALGRRRRAASEQCDDAEASKSTLKKSEAGVPSV